ncbi:MAG: hypothetical protein JRF30_05685 [Deltaproteobacteria bacterium]|nr:hypothetical protein [Deltaproteobacteria bacterium]MBW1794587.1 hypothetical protein [Deltaproteobacteria bacterium]MBW2330414.1 hypothetical protein [Deltaproteobacteria bacterium]
MERGLLENLIRVLESEDSRRFLKEVYSLRARALSFISSLKRRIVYLQALSAEEVKSRLEAMGLNQDWTFTDFDEAMIEQSSLHLWAKAIIKKKKTAVPRIFLKYIRYYKWRENLFELNKMFKYSDGLKELKNDVISHLRLNENAIDMLNRIRDEKIDKAGPFKKVVYNFFPPAINLVIVSSNSGIVIKLFLDRQDIQGRFRGNKIMIRAVVANKMAFDEKGSINGLSHKQNIIDINTKKDYIPHNNTVLVDKRDSKLKQSHPNVIFVTLTPTK